MGLRQAQPPQNRRVLLFLGGALFLLLFAQMRSTFKIAGNISRKREDLSKPLRTFRVNARASQNRWERFARMRELLKTFENVSHACASFSKHLRTFRTHAKASQNI